ncbi:MAG: DUF4139 domain-containing protein [Saprospiraceae bacterium]|nr:DUF4139 domain-containing protein [Saprospiraceae bacterium]
MKALFPLLLLSLWLSPLFAADPILAPSGIDAVKVYRNGAAVTRTASLSLPAGPVELHFPALSPFLEDNSVQVQVSKGFTILSVTSTREFLTELPMPAPYVALQDQMEKLEQTIKKDKATLEVLMEEESLLLVNKETGGQNNGVTATNLEQVATYFRTRLAAIKLEKITVSDRLAENIKQLDKLKKQQAETRQRLRPDNARTVVVRLTSLSGGKADLKLTYLAQNAGWQSTYDLRVTEINQPLGIESKGEVNNQTNEDWDKVKLTLSTGDPSRNNTVPALSPWWLNYRQPILAYQKAKEMDATNIRGSRSGATNYYLDGIRVFGALPGEFSENITTTEFAINELFTIPSDGKPYTVLLEQKSSPAEYVYITTPRRDQFAYLTATVADFESLNLSSGKANIYYGQTFIGETWLDTRQSGDSLVLSLGADVGIAVTREKIKDKSEKNFFGNKVEETHSWVIRLRNNKPGNVRIRVQDQIPISQNEDIEVKHEISNGGSLNNETGIITWEQELVSGAQQELRFLYKVKYPKGKELAW